MPICKLPALLLLASLVGLSALAGCATNPVTGERELVLISRDQEIAMGKQAAPEFEKEFGGKVPNADLQQYVQSVGRRMADVSDRPMPYTYTLVASDTPNAFALPGGPIFITAGLMKRMTNERQLAAVLGHETGHVAARHSVQQMQKQMGAQLLVEIAARAGGAEGGGTVGDVAKVVSTMAILKYSRDDEYQADELGIKYAADAGYNPWGVVELLTLLQAMQEADPGRFQEMFQTHPLSSKRIERARLMLLQDPAYEGKYSPAAADPHAARFETMRKTLVETLKK
ncbi:MAG: M48 family metallopeptidase [Phycisphaerae bacterium]